MAGGCGVPFERVVRHCTGARRSGVSLEQLLERSMIPHSSESRYGDVDPANYFLLWMNLGICTDDAAHGLGSVRLPLGHSALVLRLMLGSATLGEALAAIQRLYAISGDSAAISIVETGDKLRVEVRCKSPFGHDCATIMEDVGLSWLFICCSYYLGWPLPVEYVTVRDSSWGGGNEKHWSTGAALRADAVTAMHLPSEVLHAPRRGRTARNVFLECIREWLKSLDDERPIPNSFLQHPSATDLNLETLARRHSVSTSVLRRRVLRQSGGFRELRRRVLVNSAFHMLRDRTLSVDAVAADLGYADVRSFRRFIKTATGCTPAALRELEHLPDEKPPIEPILIEQIERMARALDLGTSAPALQPVMS